MDKTPIYQQIAEAVRQDIFYGRLTPGDRLEPVREMAASWGCTPGTVQQAYKELAREGLVVSRPGQGTHVAPGRLSVRAGESRPLRHANLVHEAEGFLLARLAAGYEAAEVEQAVHAALDRWRSTMKAAAYKPGKTLRFSGSHDPAISLVAGRFAEIAPGCDLRVMFSGSLGGLMALASGEAELAGCHLWDEESESYNLAFVRRLLPGRRVALITLAHRRLGLIVPSGNPRQIRSLRDLADDGVRLINRQHGAGTRVWLDSQLRRLDMDPKHLYGYTEEVQTHSEVAGAVAEGRADAGVGVEAAALAYGLHFVSLTEERYELVMPPDVWKSEPIQQLAQWLESEKGRRALEALGGYETSESGQVRFAEA